MFDMDVSSGGTISSLSYEEPSSPKEPFKAVAKATLALACAVPMFMPTLSSAAVTKEAQEAAYSDYAIISDTVDGTQLMFLSEPKAVAASEEVVTGLDMLFPDARSSNEYEQKIVAELINEFFE